MSKVALSNAKTVRGWVRSTRELKNVIFADLTNGSAELQCVVPQKLPTGTAVELTGLMVPLADRKQSMEFRADSVKILGSCPPDYPLQKTRLSFDFLRTQLHLRSRTRSFAAIWRIRNTLTRAIHDFYDSKGFCQVTTPILTSADCEGGGEAFGVVSQNRKEFFGKPVFLSVSGQLHLELMASAMEKVYTLGPVFRAEKSDSTRHLAEFWMLEAEMAFVTDLNFLLDSIQGLLSHVAKFVKNESFDDLKFMTNFVDPTVLDRIDMLINADYQRITYDSAIKILNKRKNVDLKLWGTALVTEEEKYLCDHFKSPVFVTNYPSNIKPFYMKKSMIQSPFGETVDCVDLLLPHICEVVGGSLRENNLETLVANMTKAGMNHKDYEWYTDTRKYGSVPLAGYGLGIERILSFITSVTNVRDLIPVPRYLGHCTM
jgi:asparaginyl-tRNA synthetase